MRPFLEVEQLLSVPSQSVWDAITIQEEMKLWYFEAIASFQPVVGFETAFVVLVGDRLFTHEWKVTEVVPRKKIAYRWRYKEYVGDSIVTFELIETSGETLLRLRHDIIEPFPSDIIEFSDENWVNGWRYFINDALPKYLNA